MNQCYPARVAHRFCLVISERASTCASTCALGSGCWLLAAGCWLLALGCWLLAVGCWLLTVGCGLPSPIASNKQHNPKPTCCPRPRLALIRRQATGPAHQCQLLNAAAAASSFDAFAASFGASSGTTQNTKQSATGMARPESNANNKKNMQTQQLKMYTQGARERYQAAQGSAINA